jgi:hypothetical protein
LGDTPPNDLGDLLIGEEVGVGGGSAPTGNLKLI